MVTVFNIFKIKRDFSLRIIQIFIILLSFLTLAPAHAKEAQTPDRYVKIRLLPAHNTITAGEEIWIGIEQSIHPHWHTYWQNPGDSGSPPRIEWNLPKGFEISEIQWPTPNKIPYPPLLNYGYENNVILLQKLKAPENLPPGPLKLSADIEILVCKDICIPEFETINLTLNDPKSEPNNNSSYLSPTLNQLPTNIDWSVSFKEKNDLLSINLNLPKHINTNSIDLTTIELFPIDWGVIDNTATVHARINDQTLIIEQKRGDRPLSKLKTISGVLSYQGQATNQRTAIEFHAENNASTTALPTTPPMEPTNLNITTLIKVIIFAIFGGLILNLMPCVFPVLSIKALSLVKIADKHPRLARMHGISYTSGVVLSFVTIAALLIALQASGAAIGWGFQLQNPIVVSLLAYLLFIIGLNLSGFFEFNTKLTNIGGKLTQEQGLSSSFFTGILATLVATPCTAPFMATAIGFALTQSAGISLIVFAAIGFGLALPYLALSFAPFLQHILPKPGAWMNTFKEFLAFPMYATSAWLVWVMSQQTASSDMLKILFGMIAITFGIWLFKHGRTKIKLLAILAFLASIALLPSGETQQTQAPTAAHKLEFGEIYSAEKLKTALTGSDPVFVEMTAAWCITCKVNHAIAINTEATKKLFAERNIRYLIGDWTKYDPSITKYLQQYGRNGVPLYVYYGPPNDETGKRPEAQILPQILTPAIVANYLQ